MRLKPDLKVKNIYQIDNVRNLKILGPKIMSSSLSDMFGHHTSVLVIENDSSSDDHGKCFLIVLALIEEFKRDDILHSPFWVCQTLKKEVKTVTEAEIMEG